MVLAALIVDGRSPFIFSESILKRVLKLWVLKYFGRRPLPYEQNDWQLEDFSLCCFCTMATMPIQKTVVFGVFFKNKGWHEKNTKMYIISKKRFVGNKPKCSHLRATCEGH